MIEAIVNDEEDPPNYDHSDTLAKFEAALRTSGASPDFTDARKLLRTYLWRQVAEPRRDSIFTAVQAIDEESKSRPDVASVLLRSLAVDHLLPQGDPSTNGNRHLVNIVEVGMPKLCEFFGLDPRSQTYEKIVTLRRVHSRVCELLEPLRSEFQTLEGLASARQAVLGALNHSVVKQYGTAFRIGKIQGYLERVFHDCSEVLKARSTLVFDVEQCEQSIREATNADKSVHSFIFLDYALPFLKRASEALNDFISSARGRFSARINISVGNTGFLPKRYPLHEVGRKVQIRIPFRNSGPGIAINVSAELSSSSKSVALQEATILLGDVLSGDFSLVVDALVVEPTAEFSADAIITWSQVGISVPDSDIFSFNVAAQASDIDWGSLEYSYPYGTDPAEGKRFIGRSEAVKALAARLLRSPMDPFYITGQKRVGKTSLALATVAFAKEIQPSSLLSTYILWGRIANADATKSLSELGRAIQSLITSALPMQLVAQSDAFSGSLSPLMKTAEIALDAAPDRRFVIIIDEFDEIHQELFLKGNLAETFFANLRALSTTKNVCLILVGGENMPFIMERQGDKLNKFTRHNVSYFSRATEWEGYLELVRNPSEGIIIWHDDAASAIFNETNGNPYFTNLVCGRIFREAVRLRDADITAEEVKSALDAEIASLDVNSFAHLWHDGIPKPIDEREPDILRRRKVLVALARCSRKGVPLTVENLAKVRGLSGPSEGEIGPTLNEFVRREVLSEMDGVFRFNLPIFERWLREGGLAVVQPDPIAEELASAVQAEEDRAFIHSDEVAALVKKWPTYQGRYVSADEVRSWYQQVDGFRDQRLLFKMLQNVNFISESELRERSVNAYVQIRSQMKDFIRRALSDRRDDLLVSYLDGEGKSGQYFASLFAEENNISVKNICRPDDLHDALVQAKAKGRKYEAIVIIDDVAASGNSLAENAQHFLQKHSDDLAEAGTKLFLCSLYATKQATDLILNRLKSFTNVECDFRSGRLLPDSMFAFAANSKLWESEDERDRARALAMDLGARVYRNQPLGYGGLGLLLVFPTTVPNNSLPILHSPSKVRSKPWHSLFLRPAN